MKKVIFNALLIAGGISLLINCSDVEFTPLPSQACIDQNAQDGSQCDVGEAGINQFYSKIDICKTDILFVVDNSGSMSTEQEKMADKFPDFLSSIDHLNYQIAVTTTDIYKDKGYLKTFGTNGPKYISKSTSNKESLFRNNVKRQETIDCDNGYNSACATNDERGIYAANLAVVNASSRGNRGNFFRDDSHLAVVFLSDEDVRGSGGRNGGEPLSSLDRPASLINNVGAYLGTHKTMSAHPIVVTSQTCSQMQLAQVSNSPFYSGDNRGLVYSEFASDASLKISGHLTNAKTGNICAGDYTNELDGIATGIESSRKSTVLACNPRNLEVRFAGQLLNINSDYKIDENNVLTLIRTNNCGELEVSYDCGR